MTAARIQGGQLVIDGKLSPRADVKPIAEDLAAGVIRNVSIGYRVYESVESKGPDGSLTVTCTDWEPFEVSIVPIAADPESHIRSSQEFQMPRKTTTAAVMDDNEIKDRTLETESDDIRDENPAPVRSVRDDRRRRASSADAIRACGRAFGATEDEIDDCLSRGLTLDRARDELQDRVAARSAPRQNPHWLMPVGRGADAEVAAAIAGALHGRMTGRAPDGPASEFMGRSMLDMGAALLEARGERVRWSNRAALVDQIMTRGGSHSTSDFPILLQQAGNRVLMDTYKAVQTPLLALARRRDASDFRAVSVVRLGEAPKLEEVIQGGEVKYGTRAEAKESFKVKTFAKIFSLTREAIINDDLGAFADVNMAWGRAAAEAEATQLVSLFTANSGAGVTMDDGNPLYHTDHSNKAASGTVIDVTNLGLARKALREMKGLDGKTPISVTPKHLVVGAAKETEAEQVLATLAASQVSDANPFSGKLTLHVEPRLTGNAWRLFADPAEVATISAAYLNGQDGPLLETRNGWDTLGTEFRCVLDFGCGIEEYRGTYLNPGN